MKHLAKITMGVLLFTLSFFHKTEAQTQFAQRMMMPLC